MDAEEFIKPPEAPVFQPTHEEFKDPIAYLSKIRPVVQNTGICKIKPPSGWRPPFSVNLETFSFTPRLQPLNELDAKTRVKLNFLDNIYKFWDMQGVSFKIPTVGRLPLDLHKLYKVVTNHGGFEEVCYTRKWTNVAREMQFDSINVSGSLRVHYEKILYPYETVAVTSGQIKLVVPDRVEGRGEEGEGQGEERVLEGQGPTPVTNDTPEKLRRSRRKRMEDPDYAFELNEDNPEFKKLAFVSPGVKNSFAPLKRSTRTCFGKKEKDDSMEWEYGNSPSPTMKTEPHDSAHPPSFPCDPRVKPLVCEECGSDNNPEELLFCRGCDLVYHPLCLLPRVQATPIGVWYCPSCISKECCQPQEAFGFEQAEKEYTLRTFGQMANRFKSNYFNKHPTEVPFSTVEKEFWRLVRSIDDDVTVEYGADLHSSVHGSGFPMEGEGEEHRGHTPDQYKYSKSGWNLNNIPNLKGSVLRHIDANISGMKVPWLYVGMCFSCFCWHTEDHWSYSINYLHWGEPKTWYGVPSAYAESLEHTMKDQAPELFENQPDLMHHLATTMSPTVLMKNGIPVVRTDQCAGEFVVTFPRAYHAGFNQGFNFAEAVNFSLADWLPVGRQSVNHYRCTRKHPVFSHDELICKMVAQPQSLDLSLLLVAARDAATMLREEEELRRDTREQGVVSEGRELFELISEEEARQCCVCTTICFLSGVRCSCNPKLLACPFHMDEMCSNCPNSNKTFKYRHTIDELRELVSSAQQKANVFCMWSDKVDKLLDGYVTPKPDVNYLYGLREEGEERTLEQCDQYQELCCIIAEAQRLQQEVYRMGGANSSDATATCTTVKELKALLGDIGSLPCVLHQTELIKSRLNDVMLYQSEVGVTLSTLGHLTNSKEGVALLRDLLLRGETLGVELTETNDLRNAISQVLWVSDTQEQLSNGTNTTMEWLRTTYKKGCTLSNCPAVDAVQNRVKSLLSLVQDWEHRTRAALREKPPRPITFYESMLSKAHDIPVVIPLADTVAQTVHMARQWAVKAQQMQAVDKDPHYDLLKELLSSSRPLPVRLDHTPQVESRYSAAKAWIDRAGRAFLKKNSSSALIEVLLPRSPHCPSLSRSTTPTPGGAARVKKRHEDEFAIVTTPLTPLQGDRVKEMAKIKDMEREEAQYLQSLRKSNLDKQRDSETRPKGDPAHPPLVYCLCRKPESGYMLQCEVCSEWYHAQCLHIPKSKLNQDTDTSKDMRFICGGCLRTRRPRLDSIVSLLISLQKVPVAISEGTALHCLAERAIAWQRKARELLGTIRAVVDAGRGQQLRMIDLRKKIKKWKDETMGNQMNQSSDIQAQLASQADSVLRHYETQLCKEKSGYLGMSDTHRKRVEEVLLEGDLLEVTTDETTQIWQLLQTDSECSSYFSLTEEEAAAKSDLPKLCQKKPTVVSEEDDDPLLANLKKRKRVERSVTPSPSSSSSKPTPPPPSDGPALPITKKKKLVRPVDKKKPQMGVTKPKTTPTKSSPHKHPKSKHQPNDPLGCTEELMEEGGSSEGEGEKGEEAMCSAGQCARPNSTAVSWVQCDTCQLWYHLVCVGLTNESVQSIAAYYCYPCKQKKKAVTDAVSVTMPTIATTTTTATTAVNRTVP